MFFGLVALCMGLLDFWVWRYGASFLRSGEREVPGGGLDPLDRPGDGLSPWDLFLRQLPTTPMDDGVGRTVAPGQ